MNFLRKISAEAWLTGMMTLVGLIGVVFMGQLVAPPKVLFGRSLTAIEPSLFPYLVLVSMTVLGGLLLYTLRRSLFDTEDRAFEEGALLRVVLLFVVMVFYALTMGLIGFLFSSFLSMMAVAWLAGNRSIPQIVLVSFLSPILLYLVATRGLAVALPELDSIEFLYARVFNMFDTAPAVPDVAIPDAAPEEPAQ